MSLVKRGVLHRDADDGNMNLFKIWLNNNSNFSKN